VTKFEALQKEERTTSMNTFDLEELKREVQRRKSSERSLLYSNQEIYNPAQFEKREELIFSNYE
jgi:hypothetical protein